MFKALESVGRYVMLMARVFAKPERYKMYLKQYLKELQQLGVNSIGIVFLIFVHRCGYHHPDQVEYRKPVDV